MRRKQALSILWLLLLTLSLAACRHALHREIKASKADSTLFNIGVTKDYELMRHVTDSFELVGDITPLDANRWRGVAYYRQGQYYMAELSYRKALECEIKTNEDHLNYNKVARRLSELLLIKGDYEGSLRIAMPAVAKMDKSGIGSDID